MSNKTFCSSSRVVGMTFSVLNNESILARSCVKIENKEIQREGKPMPGGICDPKMGTTDKSWTCLTCGQSKKYCLGHPGHIELNTPVLNISALPIIRKFIKAVCHNCGKIVIGNDTVTSLPVHERLEQASKASKGQPNKKCVYCDHPHLVIKKHSVPVLFTGETWSDKEKKEPGDVTIFPYMVKQIFERVTEETVNILGQRSHPAKFVLSYLIVPPVTIRPEVRKTSNGKGANDNLTVMLAGIITKNHAIPRNLPPVIDKKLEKSIIDLNNGIYDFMKGTSTGKNGSADSCARRLTGKHGDVRSGAQAKRAHLTGRGVITPSPTLHPTQCEIPYKFATTMFMAEYVQDFNRAELMAFVKNGRQRYPGAQRVVLENGRIYDTDSVVNGTVQITNGCVIHRDLIDGDFAQLNRQPTLNSGNISAMSVKVVAYMTTSREGADIYNPKVKTTRIVDKNTLSFNGICCPLFNADFDGDAMNIICSKNIDARVELMYLSGVDNWIKLYNMTNHMLGQFDDSVLGCFELTRDNVKIDKYHAVLMFEHSSILPVLDKDVYTGRDIISMILKPTPINLKKGSSWYRPEWDLFIDYSPTEKEVKIVNGVMLEGVLDKKTIGKGAVGGIYHKIYDEYGARASIDALYNMQRAAINYNRFNGSSSVLRDFLLSEPAEMAIDKVINNVRAKADAITSRLLKGEIVAPINKTVSEFYEEQQTAVLSTIDEFGDIILKDLRPEQNYLFKMAATGTKGSIENIFNMVSSVGQKRINGERPPEKFGFSRSLPYFTRFDTNPEARGFVQNAYVYGLTVEECIWGAIAAREDFISKSISTAVTGEQQRKSIKNLEPIHVSSTRSSTKGAFITQYATCEDGFDPRSVSKIKFPTVFMNDATLEKQYKYSNEAPFDAEYERVLADRNKYRNIYMQYEKTFLNEFMSDERELPVDIHSVIHNYLMASPGNQVTKEDVGVLKEMVNTVADFCELIGYLFTNKRQQELRRAIPAWFSGPAWLIGMNIRSHLSATKMAEYKLTPELLKKILLNVEHKILSALINPGTPIGILAAQMFSSPLTQYLLDAHHRSASGGTTDATTRSKEVLGAKPTSSMKAPQMSLPIKDISATEEKAQEIANSIEMLKITNLVIDKPILYERFGQPIVHPQDESLIKKFVEQNPLLNSSELVNWCIRYVLNKETMILKNVTMAMIVKKIYEYSLDFCPVYSNDNDEELVLRIYINNKKFGSTVNLESLEKIQDEIDNIIVRGLDGVTLVKPVKVLRSLIGEDGGVVKKEGWAIQTLGTNLSEVMWMGDIDVYQATSDSIQEIYELLGIEAARAKVAAELHHMVESCNPRFISIYADEMTSTGRVTSIEKSGLGSRMGDSVLLRMGFSSPVQVLDEAAIHNRRDVISGLTPCIIVGSTPKLGTTFNTYMLNIPKMANSLIGEADVFA